MCRICGMRVASMPAHTLSIPRMHPHGYPNTPPAFYIIYHAILYEFSTPGQEMELSAPRRAMYGRPAHALSDVAARTTSLHAPMFTQVPLNISSFWDTTPWSFECAHQQARNVPPTRLKFPRASALHAIHIFGVPPTHTPCLLHQTNSPHLQEDSGHVLCVSKPP